MYTQNLELFGHKEDITLFVLDNTPASPDSRPSDRDAAFSNRAICESYREQGFKVRYLSREEQEFLRKKYVDFLTERYTELPVDELDPQTQQDVGVSLRDRFTEIIDYAFATQNIAGARTVTVALTGGNMSNWDDDSAPWAATVTREMRQEVECERSRKEAELLEEMYLELSVALGLQISSQEDIDDLLICRTALTRSAQCL